MAMSSPAITHLGILDIGGSVVGIWNRCEQICLMHFWMCTKYYLIALDMTQLFSGFVKLMTSLVAQPLQSRVSYVTILLS